MCAVQDRRRIGLWSEITVDSKFGKARTQGKVVWIATSKIKLIAKKIAVPCAAGEGVESKNATEAFEAFDNMERWCG